MSWRRKLGLLSALVVIAILAIDGLTSSDISTAEGVRSLIDRALEGSGEGGNDGSGEGVDP